MVRVRLNGAATRLASSLLVLVLAAATRAQGACNATCKRDFARCMATQCAGVGRGACRRHCKPGASASNDAGAPGHFPTDAVAIWLAAPGQTTLNANPRQPDSGTIVALRDVRSFGGRPVDANGDFMDFDGADQPAGPDVDTRGMLVCDPSGAVSKRYYVNVYPALTVNGTLGAGHPGSVPGHAGRSQCERHKQH